MELHHAVTDDGWRLALHHYPASRGAPGRRHPVICCHGLAANRLAFDVDPEVSLARHLAGRGYEVLAVELRGHGASERRRGARWSFDDYLTRDLPAAIEHARRLFGCERLHWIGHSMGGLLAYAHLSRGGSSDLRSAVTVGSSLDYSTSHSGFARLAPARGLLDHVPAVPVRALARLSALAVGKAVTPFERFNVWPSNCSPELWRRVCRHGFHPVSPPVMRQLATALEAGGLRSFDGSRRYLDGLGEASTPVLALAGDRDPQCPPEAAQRTIEALGDSSRLLVFGPEQGHADHYGHFDLLIGRRVHAEVFPHVDAWLDEHD